MYRVGLFARLARTVAAGNGLLGAVRGWNYTVGITRPAARRIAAGGGVAGRTGGGVNSYDELGTSSEFEKRQHLKKQLAKVRTGLAHAVADASCCGTLSRIERAGIGEDVAAIRALLVTLTAVIGDGVTGR